MNRTKRCYKDYRAHWGPSRVHNAQLGSRNQSCDNALIGPKSAIKCHGGATSSETGPQKINKSGKAKWNMNMKTTSKRFQKFDWFLKLLRNTIDIWMKGKEAPDQEIFCLKNICYLQSWEWENFRNDHVNYGTL